MRANINPQVNILELARRIQPQTSELKAARSHLITVRRRLNSSFDISKIVVIGSHSRHTAIRWYSDLDVMAVLRRNEAKWGDRLVSSSTLITRVRNDLNDRYVNTDVRRDQQAVVVGFADQQQSLDVVPALFNSFGKARPIFIIPDGEGGWLETSPEAHDSYFAKSEEKSGGKLKRLIQLIKWWKFAREQPIPIQSFYLDLLLASSDICVGVKPYTYCLYEAFKLLADRDCRGLRDPVGIAGVVNATKTEAQRGRVNDAVSYALDHSRAAIAAAAVKDLIEANRQWGLVFNGNY